MDTRTAHPAGDAPWPTSPLAPVPVLHVSNGADALPLPPAPAHLPSLALTRVQVDALDETTLAALPLATPWRLVLLDWRGPLAPAAVQSLHACCGAPLLVLGDGEQAAGAAALLAAGAADWISRTELTPYWLERTLRQLLAVADTTATAVAQAQRRAAQYEQALHQLPIGVILVDGDPPRIVYANEQSRTIWQQPLAPSAADFAAQDAAGNPLTAGGWPFGRVLLPGAQRHNETLQIHCADGATRIVQVNAVPIAATDGAVGHTALAVIEDITDRVGAAEALVTSERRLRTALQATTMAAWEWDAASGSVWISNAITAIDGLPAEAPPAARMALMEPADRARHMALIQRIQREGGQYRTVLRVRHAITGAPRYLEEAGTAEAAADGSVLRITGTLHDVTARYELEALAREGEHRINAMLKSAPLTLIQVDRDLRYTAIYNAQLFQEQVSALLGKEIGSVDPSPGVAHIAAVARSVIATGVGQRTDYAIETSRGRLYFDVTVEPTRASDAEITGATLVAVDVTHHKQLEQALRDNHASFDLVVKHAPIFLARLDTDLRYRWVQNPTPGRTSDEYVGKRVGEVFASPASDRMRAWTAEVLRTGQGLRRMNELDLPTQGPVSYDVTIEPVFDDAGTLDGVAIAALDVTPHRQLQRALAASERRYRTLVQSTAVGVFQIAAGTARVLAPAPVWESFSGQQWPAYAQGEWVQQAHADDLAAVQACVQAVRDGVSVEQRTEARFMHAATQVQRWCELRLVPVRNDDGSVSEWVGALRDIHDRKMAEQRAAQHARDLQASEARFVAFMEHLPAHAFIKDGAGRYLFVNSNRAKALGIARADWLGHTDAELQPHQSHLEWQAHDRKVLADGAPDKYTTSLTLSDGVRRMFVVKFPMPTLTGEPQLGGVLFDITQQEQAEAALAFSEERLRMAVSGGELGMWDWTGGDSVLLNRRLCSYAGVEAVGEDTPVALALLRTCVHPADLAQIEQEIGALLARGGEYRSQLRVQGPDGEIHWLLIIGQLHAEDDVRPRCLGVAIDITESKRAEALIRQAQEELEQRVALRTRQLAVTNVNLQREIEERRAAQMQLEEIRRLVARSQETERMHLAHELHDGPMQDLAALGMELARLGQKLHDATAAAELATLRARLKEVNLALRSVASDLRPPLLDSFGLSAALASLVEQAQARAPATRFVAHLPEQEEVLGDEVSLALYRVCQQALHNIQQHARASSVEVRLECTPDAITLAVQDDGRGFDVPTTWVNIGRAGHLGLLGMDERMRALGGSLEAHSQPGQGVRITAHIPRTDGAHQSATPSRAS